MVCMWAMETIKLWNLLFTCDCSYVRKRSSWYFLTYSNMYSKNSCGKFANIYLLIRSQHLLLFIVCFLVLLMLEVDLAFISIYLYLQDRYLVYILTEMPGSSTMVFTWTCDATRLLALMLRNLGQRAIPISGQMSQVYKSKWHIFKTVSVALIYFIITCFL